MATTIRSGEISIARDVLANHSLAHMHDRARIGRSFVAHSLTGHIRTGKPIGRTRSLGKRARSVWRRKRRNY